MAQQPQQPPQQNASESAWDGNAARYPDADSYCAACLMDTNPAGKAKTKGLCHLPVFPPGSKTPNRTAMGAAASALVGGRGGVAASAPDKKKAARKLVALYARIGQKPPPALATLAQ